jgi:hypothetical protein
VRAGLFSQPAQVSSPGVRVRDIRQRPSATNVPRRGSGMPRKKPREFRRISNSRRTVWMLPTLSNTPHRLDWCEAGVGSFARMADRSGAGTYRAAARNCTTLIKTRMTKTTISGRSQESNIVLNNKTGRAADAAMILPQFTRQIKLLYSEDFGNRPTVESRNERRGQSCIRSAACCRFANIGLY